MKINIWKWLRILGWTVGIFIALLLVLGWVVAYFFADDIKQAIDKEIAKTVNAHVEFSERDFSISFLWHFPHIAVSQSNFRVIGKDEFSRDTLLSVRTFRVSVDIWKTIFGKPEVRGVYLDTPRIHAKVLRNGKANWDIVVPAPPDTTKKTEPEQPTKFDVTVKWWQIDNGFVEYDDKAQRVYARIGDIKHKGSGNFTESIFDLSTYTLLDKFTVSMGDADYLTDKRIEADMTLNMNLTENKYTFKDNKFRLNDFAFGFTGFVQLLKDKISMDMVCEAQETQFKNILSLVPGMYTKDFAQLKTDGTLAFKAFAKGDYQGAQIPKFGLELKVDKGMFQYPALPLPVKNVNFDLKVDNNTGNITETIIHLAKCHLDIGTNPIDVVAKIERFVNPLLDIKALAKVNLAEIMQAFPMQGTTLRGTYELDAKVEGVYNSGQFPTVAALMKLSNGYVKSAQFPEALENLQLAAQVNNSTGKYEDTKIRIDNFSMLLDKEPFAAKGFIENLADAVYKFEAKGIVDLAKIAKIFPAYFVGMELAGRINADITTEGKQSLVLAGKYDQLPTSGFVKISDFLYRDKVYLPQGFRLKYSETNFTPKTIEFAKTEGFLGKSDFTAQGSLSNYLAYTFKGETLKGVMTVSSNTFDLNEWMPATPTPSPSPKPVSKPAPAAPSTSTPAPSAVVEIPRNIDFVLDAAAKRVEYAKMPLSDFKGKIVIRDGKIQMNDITFGTLGGAFATSGMYDPTDKLHPKYSFAFGIKDLPLAQAYQAFATTGDGLANKYTGKLFTDFKVSGELSQQLMPLYDRTMNGSLNVNLLQGAIQDVQVIKQLNSFLKLDDPSQISLKDLVVNGKIENGRVNYQPFALQAAGYKFDVTGSNGLDGGLDFKLKTVLPKEKLTVVGQSALAGFANKAIQELDNKELMFGLTGNAVSPKFLLLSVGGIATQNIKEQVKETIKQKTEAKKTEVIGNLKSQADERAQAIIAEAQRRADDLVAQAQEQANKIKAEADAAYQKSLDEAYNRAYQEAADRVPIGKAKVGDAAGKAARELANKAAAPLRQQAYAQADNLVSEARSKSDKIISDAKANASKLK